MKKILSLLKKKKTSKFQNKMYFEHLNHRERTQALRNFENAKYAILISMR